MNKKIVTVMLVLVLTISVFQTAIYATGFDWSGKMNDMTSTAGDSNVIDPVNEMAGTAITVAQVIAVGVAIIMLLVLAMKYMLSAPGDKASIKKHAVVYIIGAVVMFASTGILEIIRKFSKTLSETTSS